MTILQGGHVVDALRKRGDRVRAVDIQPMSFNSESNSGARLGIVETLRGNLCDQRFCRQAVVGVHVIVHFAATMGGMGTIHGENDLVIYAENHAMVQNLVVAALDARVHRFFFASSACVYPEALQSSTEDRQLAENDVWDSPPPRPQGLYGQEKLVSELYLQHLAREGHLEIRIARFHNCYGPGGAFDNGREKVPAAFLRKAFAIKLGNDRSFEIWGDGSQRRSFVFIVDAVKAVLLLLDSDCSDPMNIGSEQSVSINDLAAMALRCADLQVGDVTLQHAGNRPLGVASRNADLTKVRGTLGWEPQTSLEAGMRSTGQWIESQMVQRLQGLGETVRARELHEWKMSRLVHLCNEGAVTFAILLPITSRGSGRPEECLDLLATFAQSLVRTAADELNALGRPFAVKIFLAIDHDDSVLAPSDGRNPAADVLHRHGILSVDTATYNFPRGHVCALWRACARRAFEAGCDYFVLMGDDIVLEDRGWMSEVEAAFAEISAREGVPLGFGCVAFRDETFPGMPTFPVIHRTHLDIFHGDVIPETFVNQDGDPYLYQLYRHWGASTMIASRLRNTMGGELEARYQKRHAARWTFGPLSRGVETVSAWLKETAPAVAPKLTLDIVVPSYRVQVPLLEAILDLQPSPTCSVMWIIIVDDPKSTAYYELMRKYGTRMDVRIRRHDENLGASTARNRGLQESAAKWVHFLDDDVVPAPNLLVEAEKAIRAAPDAAGFIGDTRFPVADSIFKTAVHLAGVTYFWSIAARQTELGQKHGLPWGVTANIIARRNISDEDDVAFDLRYPKTGGGEDIAYCIDKEALSRSEGGRGFLPAPAVIATHPWWMGGARSYWRFYGWGHGDGALVRAFPEQTYRDVAPNSAECFMLCALALSAGAGFALVGRGWGTLLLGAQAVSATFVANVAHDAYRLTWEQPVHAVDINSSITGSRWALAVLESSLIRMFSEVGRLVGVFKRREFSSLGRRFDWFVGKAGSGPRDNERRHNAQRVVFTLALLAALRRA
jgi:nucleoside-diphosphate-sugar epimerase